MDTNPGHTVTGPPAPPPAHAARPPTDWRIPALLAAAAVLAGAVAAVLLTNTVINTSEVNPGAPPSARSITVTPTVPLSPAVPPADQG